MQVFELLHFIRSPCRSGTGRKDSWTQVYLTNIDANLHSICEQWNSVMSSRMGRLIYSLELPIVPKSFDMIARNTEVLGVLGRERMVFT
jgi:hypothetical protein